MSKTLEWHTLELLHNGILHNIDICIAIKEYIDGSDADGNRGILRTDREIEEVVCSTLPNDDWTWDDIEELLDKEGL